MESSWKIPSPPEFDKWLREKDSLDFYKLPGYDYLAYLRHHGFPSPLLDWTESFFIAAFFAFNEFSKNSQFVSIYAYLEHAGVGKIKSSDRPAIQVFGPYVKAHKRHVLQQCQYTICTELDENDSPVFANHESVFNENEDNQDRLWKFSIPSNERLTALKSLNEMNINAFSLFGNEDSLIESIATNEIIKNHL